MPLSNGVVFLLGVVLGLTLAAIIEGLVLFKQLRDLEQANLRQIYKPKKPPA